VMMLVELRVEARSRAGVACPGDQAQRNERSKDAVDRHTRDLGQLGADRAVKLLGGGVVRAGLDGFEDGAPLRGHRQTAFAVGGEEPLHSLLIFCPTHFADDGMHQMIKICKQIGVNYGYNFSLHQFRCHVLQQSSALNPANWTAYPDQGTLNPATLRNEITIPATNNRAFLRLSGC
jgi:hypothetical protein